MFLYVMSRPHSGSTILDILLGNTASVESVGQLVSDMGKLDNPCACGATIRTCPFWSEVRERVEGTTLACAELISEVIREDAGLPKEQSRMLAVGLVGMAQVSARYWLAEGGSIPRDAASRLLASLSWRGIGGFPLLEQ